jgi:translation initiation factor IF-3
MFRGREVTHPERGTMILDRLAEELAELGVVEQRPMQEGRNMTMMMAPSKAVLAGRVDGEHGEEAPAEGSADGAVAATPGATSEPQTTAEVPANGAAAVEPAPEPQAAETPSADGAESAEQAPAETVDTPVADGGTAAAGSAVS